MRRSLFAAFAVVIVVSVAAAPAKTVKTAPAPTFAANVKASVVGAGGNEPSGITASDGTRYVSYQSGTHVVKAAPGKPWRMTGYSSFTAGRAPTDPDEGDVTMAADNAGTVFVGHLGGPLNADIDYTRDGGSTWKTASNVLGLTQWTSAQPLMVDRPWIAAYSPSTNAADTKVYMEYHDFWDPNAIWMVPCSMATGELKCQAGGPVSGPESACDTIPGPFSVAPPGSPHEGRVYAIWVTADPLTNATTGCNTTQLAPFYSVYSAWSDNADAGPQAKWNVKLIFAGEKGEAKCAGKVPGTGSCDDNGNLFPHLAVDNGGNVYAAWAGYISQIDPHYDVFMSSSTDGGDTWSKTPHRVDRSPGVEVMPALVAGDAGRIAIAWVGTTFDSQPYGAGDPCPMNVPPMFACAGKPKPQAASAPWHTYLAQSLDAASNKPHFSLTRVSEKVVHYGDYCTLGIYCDGSETGNRSLLDAIALYVDEGGWIQIAWTDQREDKENLTHAKGATAGDAQQAFDQIYTACQNGGVSLYKKPAAQPSCTRVLSKKYRR